MVGLCRTKNDIGCSWPEITEKTWLVRSLKMTSPNQSPAPRSTSVADGGDADPWAGTPARGPAPTQEAGAEKTSGGTGGATSGGSAEAVSTPERKKKIANLEEGPPRNDELENQDHVVEGQHGAGATATRTPDTP